MDAQSITINYSGGSITMPVGNAKDLFGDNSQLLRPELVTLNFTRKSHTRVNVIGGPSTSVAAADYSVKQWPRSAKSQSAGGQKIVMRWEESDGDWVARMTGPAHELGNFLNTSSPKLVTFWTKGSKYGPFIAEKED